MTEADKNNGDCAGAAIDDEEELDELLNEEELLENELFEDDELEELLDDELLLLLLLLKDDEREELEDATIQES